MTNIPDHLTLSENHKLIEVSSAVIAGLVALLILSTKFRREQCNELRQSA